jgi:hypothetical protein
MNLILYEHVLVFLHFPSGTRYLSGGLKGLSLWIHPRETSRKRSTLGELFLVACVNVHTLFITPRGLWRDEVDLATSLTLVVVVPVAAPASKAYLVVKLVTPVFNFLSVNLPKLSYL